MTAPRHVYSCVVDAHPQFAYQAWHLARSLVARCGAQPCDIHIHLTPGVSDDVAALFEAQGYRVHPLVPFGDGRYCNKIAQLDALAQVDFDIAVLLDTDMVAIADLRAFTAIDAIVGKVVDCENPSRALLEELFASQSLAPMDLRRTDSQDGATYAGNCNGGFYAVPKRLADTLAREWKRWALMLLADGRMAAEGKQAHCDQVGFCLAIRSGACAFRWAPSNANLYVHFAGEHAWLDPDRPVALVHYHQSTLNVVGRIEPPPGLSAVAAAAVAEANRIIDGALENRLFWEFRYACFPERGSGVGSRGENARYKRDLLRAQGIEAAASVLDVGCGDLEVVGDLDLHGYVGVDRSPEARRIAAVKRPDWRFAPSLDGQAPAEAVLCLEVLIHQGDRDAYVELVRRLSSLTRRFLIVSGYSEGTQAIAINPMVFFHEPLDKTLTDQGVFATITPIGGHSDVVVYRCDRKPDGAC